MCLMLILLYSVLTTPIELPSGTIIAYYPANTSIYIGSPGITIVKKGVYLAKHDEFGPNSTEHTLAVTHIYRSEDKGNSWKRISSVRGMFWTSIFNLNGKIYLIGTDRHHGNMVIRRSDDEGYTWTEPTSPKSGILDYGQYHTAPVPVIVHQRKVWRAFEDALGSDKWGDRYRALVISAPVDSNLLDADNWTFSNVIPKNKEWLNGEFYGWLEGNIVPVPDGTLVNMLRVDTRPGGKSAIIKISPDGKTIEFDSNTGFVDFNGGTTKFTIRYDEISKKYWTLCNWPSKEEVNLIHPARIRNTLVLAYSKDLRNWEACKTILHHPDMVKHGFQYADWLFEENDIIAVVRTAYDDNFGGAHNFHDANYLTFHRIKDFRSLCN